MSERKLTDKVGNVIGYIKTESDGQQKLTDRIGNRLGYYDPKSDKTRDKIGNIVGGGNLLPILLGDISDVLF